MTKRLASLAALTVLTVSLLSGCGGDGGSDSYCSTIKDAQKNGADMNTEEGLSLAKDVRDAAPDEIQDDWDALISVVDTGSGTLDPAKIDPTKANQAMESIRNIEKYTKKECGVDLNAS